MQIQSVCHWERNIMMIAVISVLALGWLLAATIGTYAYFANDLRLEKSTNSK